MWDDSNTWMTKFSNVIIYSFIILSLCVCAHVCVHVRAHMLVHVCMGLDMHNSPSLFVPVYHSYKILNPKWRERMTYVSTAKWDKPVSYLHTSHKTNTIKGARQYRSITSRMYGQCESRKTAVFLRCRRQKCWHKLTKGKLTDKPCVGKNYTNIRQMIIILEFSTVWHTVTIHYSYPYNCMESWLIQNHAIMTPFLLTQVEEMCDTCVNGVTAHNFFPSLQALSPCQTDKTTQRSMSCVCFRGEISDQSGLFCGSIRDWVSTHGLVLSKI